MALSCYLDDSDDSLSSVLTLGGYVGDEEGWARFEAAAENVLADYGVHSLHAKEFHHRQKEFRGWSRQRKMDFIQEIYSHVASNGIFGIFASISKKDFLALRESKPEYKSIAGLSVCFSGLCNRLIVEGGDFVANLGVDFYLERGHKNNGGVNKIYNTIASSDKYRGVVRSFVEIPKDSCRAIQLADFLVYHARRWTHSVYSNPKASDQAWNEVVRAISQSTLHIDLIITASGEYIEMQRLTPPSAQSLWVINETK